MGDGQALTPEEGPVDWIGSNIDAYVIAKNETGSYMGVPIDGALNVSHGQEMPLMPSAWASILRERLPLTLARAFEVRTQIDDSDRSRSPVRRPMLLPIDFAFQGAVVSLHARTVYRIASLHPVDKENYRKYLEQFREAQRMALASALNPAPGEGGLPGLRLHAGR
jgi:hypothetical protein